MFFKNTLRKEITRNLQRVNNREELSRLITQNLISIPLWEKSSNLFIYISFKGEVITNHLIDRAGKEGKKIYAPLIRGKNMGFFRIDNILKSDLVLNRFGIYEPPEGLIESFPDDKSIMIIPGLAFTPNGDRMGRGGGYYDRYLAENRVLNKVAITFELQIKDNIPTEEWDKKIDIVVSEKRIYGGL
jgi:5-formyltetrahydrofolate cyclo-ligase